MQKIIPCLWFDDQAEEAMRFYVSVFKNSQVGDISYYGEAGPGEAGKVLTVTFTIDGQEFMGLNGGPEFKFSEAVSFVINCEDQAEVDYYWAKLTEGGEESMCGWLKDKYGVSWQIVPTVLDQLLSSGDGERTDRTMQALLHMRKLDIAALQRAYDGV